VRRARPIGLLTALLTTGALLVPAQSALAAGRVGTRALMGVSGLVRMPGGGEPSVVGDAPGPVVTGRIVLGSAYRGVPGLGVVLEKNSFYGGFATTGWATVGRAVTDSQGYVRIRMPKPTRNMSFRVRFGGTTKYLPSASTAKHLTVQPVVTVTGAPAEIVAGVPYTVTGTVRPAGLTGVHVELETACHDGTSWAMWQTRFPVAPDGTFAIHQTFPAGQPAVLGATAIRIFIGDDGYGSGVNDGRSTATPTAVVKTAGDPHIPGGPGDCVTIRLQ
jgi:hypothetical protein